VHVDFGLLVYGPSASIIRQQRARQACASSRTRGQRRSADSGGRCAGCEPSCGSVGRRGHPCEVTATCALAWGRLDACRSV